MSLDIRQFPCLNDNYGYLICDMASGAVATIDTPAAEAINQELEKAGWRLTHILNTHHHFDHTGGNLALKERWGCKIIGPRAEAARIPGIDEQVGDGDTLMLGDSRAVVIDTPGHTSGHIIFHFEEDGAAFVGDTIFAAGCGRLFEGTPAQMWDSLLKIADMPARTKLYCAHEYTMANVAFALSVDGENEALRARKTEVDRLRAEGLPTVPTTVADELATNPFLRARDDDFKAGLGMNGASDVDVFAEARRRKDSF